MIKTKKAFVFSLFLAVSQVAHGLESGLSAEFESARPSFSLDLQVAGTSYPNYQLGNGSGASQHRISPQIQLSWVPVSTQGKLAFGVGYRYYANENVAVTNPNDANSPFSASLFTNTLLLGMSYHFDFDRSQAIVPFLRAGANLNWVKQSSATASLNRGDFRADAWSFTGGLQILLNNLDAISAKKFFQYIGVQSTYLVLAYERTTPIRDSGLATDSEAIQAGLRFEF